MLITLLRWVFVKLVYFVLLLVIALGLVLQFEWDFNLSLLLAKYVEATQYIGLKTHIYCGSNSWLNGPRIRPTSDKEILQPINLQQIQDVSYWVSMQLCVNSPSDWRTDLQSSFYLQSQCESHMQCRKPWHLASHLLTHLSGVHLNLC